MANFPYRLYGGATRPDAISGLNAQFSSALEQLYQAAPPDVQSQLGLTSGYRSKDVQRRLWEASDRSGHMVAAPGHSQHNFGLAADLYGFGTGGGSVTPEARQWVHQNAPNYGLAFPMSYEPWHVQLAGDTKASPGTPGIFEQPTPAPIAGMGGMVTPTSSPPSQIPLQPIDPWVPMTPERFFQQMVAGQNPMRQIVFHRIAQMLS
jgi:hypothetical protein